MEAGVSNHLWSLEEIAALVPKQEAKKRGPFYGGVYVDRCSHHCSRGRVSVGLEQRGGHGTWQSEE